MLGKIDNIVDSAVERERARVVNLISEYSGISKDDLYAAIGTTKTNSKPSKPTIPLPFCNVIEATWCKSIRVNHGLFTQCTNTVSGGTIYCKTCAKKVLDGVPEHGNIHSRLDKKDWSSPTGRTPTSYFTILNKLDIPITKAKEQAKNMGWEIPASELVQPPRGRPRKPRKQIVNSQGNRIIAALIKEAASQSPIDYDYLQQTYVQSTTNHTKLTRVTNPEGDDILVDGSGNHYDLETQCKLSTSS